MFKQVYIKMEGSEMELNKLLREEDKGDVSSEEEQEGLSRSTFRKPLKQPYSDPESDSSAEAQDVCPVLPPPAQKQKSVLQQAQESMRWDKDERLETEILGRLEGNGMKEKKIRELANKYKALHVAYEKEKTFRKNLEGQLNTIMTNHNTKTNANTNTNANINTNANANTNATLVMESKCVHCVELEKKIMQMRLKSQAMKTELNKAQRVISREIGQDFDIDKALSEENGWKGRQQKIERLKNRVKELEDRLQSNGVNVSHMSGFTQMSSNTLNSNNTQAFSATRSSALQAENKRKELDNLKVQVEALKAENDLLQGKVKGLTSRKATLESEVKDTKAEFEKKKMLFIEKSDNDDKFIALLKAQNQKLKKEERVITKVIYKDQGNVEHLKKEVEGLRRRLVSSKKEEQKNSTKDEKKQSNSTKVKEKQSNIVWNERKREKSINNNNEKREISAEKKEQIANEYINSNKYLKPLSVEDEEEIYRNWKQSKGK